MPTNVALTVNIISASKLKAKDVDGTSDPFCVVELVRGV